MSERYECEKCGHPLKEGDETHYPECSAVSVEPDFTVEGGGTVYLFRPHNEAAREHLTENVQDGAQWFGGALVVEHRYAADLAEGLRDNGFTVE